MIQDVFLYPDHGKEYFPTNFQFRGSKATCVFSHPKTMDSQILTTVPSAVSVPSLTVHLQIEISIQCLILKVFEMNVGTEAKIMGITGTYTPFLGTHLLLTNEWTGNAPSFSDFCTHQVSNNIHSMNSCSKRKTKDLYKLNSGYQVCQCDFDCKHHGDCCNDQDRFNASLTSPTSSAIQLTCSSTQFPSDFQSGFGFYSIFSCNTKSKGKEIERRCKSDAGILSFIPFEVNGLVYRNVFCAICNEETISVSDAWPTTLPSECSIPVVQRLQKFISNYSDSLEIEIDWCELQPDMAFPKTDNLSHGQTRMGKLCIVEKEKKSDSQIQAAGQKDVPNYVLMTDSIFSIANDLNCICDHCRRSFFSYLTADFQKVSQFFLNPSKQLMFVDIYSPSGPGSLSSIFENDHQEGPVLLANPKEELEFPFPDVTSSEKKVESEDRFSIILSLIGSSLSILFLVVVLVYMFQCEGVRSKAKRCQVTVLLGKLLFYFAICGGTALRRYEQLCKFFAVFLHFAILNSFMGVILFGIKLSWFLWKMKQNMAAFSFENQQRDIDKKELATYLSLWGGVLFIVLGFWCHDTFIDAGIFGYGMNEDCLLTGYYGKLYSLVVPTTVAVATNIGVLVMLFIQFRSLIEDATGRMLLTFMGRLVVFQSSQWIFGVVYFFNQDYVSKYLFEIFVAYEGLFIFLTRHTSNIFSLITEKMKLCREKFLQQHETE